MQYQNRQKYDEATEWFSKANKKKFEDKEFDKLNESKNLVLYDLTQLDSILKSYFKDNQIQESGFYQSKAIINAFNIVQQNMSSLKQLFEQRDDGLFGVWLWVQGEQRLVIVDGQIPCQLNGNHPLIATIQSKYEWPIILQKAIGKLLELGYDSFNRLRNISIDFFIYMITGSFTYEQEFQSLEELERKARDKQIILYVQYVVGADTLASVVEITQNSQPQEQKLIRLIAPNHEFIFQKGIQKDQYSCILPWQEFKQYFKTVNVLHWKDDYRVTSLSLENPIVRNSDFIEHTYLLKFKINVRQNYQLSLWQKDYIINNGSIEIKNKESKKTLGLIRMLLFQELKPNSYKFIDGACQFQGNISINQTLDIGDHYLICQGYFNFFQNDVSQEQKDQTKLNFSIKGLNVPEKIDFDDQWNFKKINLITSLMKSQCSLNNTRSFNSIGQPKILVTTKKMYGFLYFYYENKGTIDIFEEIQFIKEGYLINYDSLQQQRQFQVEIKQNHFKILLFILHPKIILQQETSSFIYEYKHTILDQPQQNQILDNFQLVSQNERTKKFFSEDFDGFITQHKQGIIFQFQNNSERVYFVTLNFTELQNLSLASDHNLNIDGLTVKFTLQKYGQFQIFFDIIDPNFQYHHKMTLECSKLN